MKIIKKIVFSILALFFMLVIGVVIFIKTFDINRFKPQILLGAKNFINRQIDFSKAKLDLSLTQGISLKINDLVISEDPVFMQGDFFTVREVSLGVDMLAYITSRSISVTSVLIDSPRITIIRQKDGSLNLNSLTQSQKQNPGGGVSMGGAPVLFEMPALMVSSLKLVNGNVVYRDNSFSPPVSLEISKLNLSANNLSLTGSFPFTLEGAVLSDKSNIKFQGLAQIDVASSRFSIIDLKGSSALSEISIKKISEAFPMVKEDMLPGSLRGKLDLVLQKMVIAPAGLSDLLLDFSLSRGAVQLKQIVPEVSELQILGKVINSDILIQKVSATIGEGKVTSLGQVNDYLLKQGFNFTGQIENLKIQELLNQEKAAAKIEGIISGSLSCKGEGFTQEALNSSLSGQADLLIAKGKLKDINIFRAVLEKISIIPGLMQKVDSAIPQRYKQKLSGPDTEFSDIKLSVILENSRLLIRNIVLSAPEFTLKGDLLSGFDGAYMFEGAFLIPLELSSPIVEEVRELKFLLDGNKQIYIPLKISGNASGMKFKVDMEYIGKRILSNQAQQFLNILREPNKETQGSSGQDAANPQTENKAGLKEAVEGVLGDFLKKKKE